MEKKATTFNRIPAARTSFERLQAEQVLSRAAGAPLIAGNRLRLLRDAAENYPAWLAAIQNATHHIHFENYIIQDDAIGRKFLASLTERANAGVKVRVLYDWLGGLFTSSSRLFQPLMAAGGEVRCFNPAQIGHPLAWATRDHRKLLVVDSQIGFVTGLCVSQRWAGNPERQLPAWRDTGIAIEGPAITDLNTAFAQTWALSGDAIPADEIPPWEGTPPGDTTLRVIAGTPHNSSLYRLDKLISTMARESLWLTDAYFVGSPTYTHALCAAAQDGVDVRLLVPSATDIPLLSPFSRAGYRPLLEAGVRVFEWNGPMIHAKTAVADGRWARVGSSNLNLASWINNYELDVAVEDANFAKDMEAMFLEDLQNATEIVLSNKQLIRPTERRRKPRGRDKSTGVASAVRLGNTMASAFQQQRTLGPVEAFILFMLGLLLLAVAVVSWYWPHLITLPIAVISLWLSASLLARAWKLRKRFRLRPEKNQKIKNSSGKSTPSG